MTKRNLLVGLLLGALVTFGAYQVLSAQEDQGGEELPPAEQVEPAQEAPAAEAPEAQPAEPAQPAQIGAPVGVGSGEYVLKNPRGFEKLYPPVHKRYEFRRLMDSLAKYFWMLKLDIANKDWDYVEFSFRLFARQYLRVKQTLPELGDYFKEDLLDQLAKELKIAGPEEEADTGVVTLEEQKAHEEETLTEEDKGTEGEEEGMKVAEMGKAGEIVDQIWKESCQKCHTEWRPAVYIRFYWGTRGMRYSMSTFRLNDPASKKKDLTLKEYMHLLADAFYGIQNGIAKGRKVTVRKLLPKFEKRLRALDKACGKCHWDQPEKYTLITVMEELKALNREAKRYKPRKEVLNKALKTIQRDVCQGCHVIHVPAYQIQEAWEGKAEK